MHTPVSNSATHLQLGSMGEHIAAQILLQKGYKILSRNWHYGKLELDLICENGDQIIFVEVKTRSRNTRGGAVAAITENKKRNLGKAAQAWLKINNIWNKSCRFDVICLIGNDKTFRMEHYYNAFDISQALDRGNTNWQPW